MSGEPRPGMPRRLRQRPKDHRGLPIPFTVPIIDGKPEFRSSDADRWRAAVRHRRCALCGEELPPAGGWFVGGPRSARLRAFLDPAMHRDCAEYALKVCPFLAATRGHFSDLERRPMPAGHTLLHGHVLSQRPDRFMLGLTRGWAVRPQPDGVPMIFARPWIELYWWRHGEPIEGDPL